MPKRTQVKTPIFLRQTITADLSMRLTARVSNTTYPPTSAGKPNTRILVP